MPLSINLFKKRVEMSESRGQEKGSPNATMVDDIVGNGTLQQYSIVKAIMENLCLRDLLAASQVCATWSEVGRVVRRQRKNRCNVLLYHPYLNHSTEAFEYFNGGVISDAANEFMNNAQLQGFPSAHVLVESQGWEELLPRLRAGLRKGFLETFFEPQLLILTGTAAVDEYIELGLDDVQRNDESLEVILGNIKQRIPCLVSFSYGIVSPMPLEPTSLEMENSEFPVISGLLIPKFDGLKIKTFHLTKGMESKYKGKVDKENCREILNIEPEDQVQGILLFLTDSRRGYSIRDAVFHYIKDNPHVAVGGGSHYKNFSNFCDDNNQVAHGIVICGKKNVTTAAIGLFDSKMTSNNENKIKELKTCEHPGGDSFAIMFACNGRGASMHGSPHVESTLFRKHFPKTNLIGTFTGGEYCHEVVPTREEKPNPPKKPSNLEFAFTTVIVYVSYDVNI